MPRSRRQDSPLRADSSATTPPGRAHPATSNPESCASDLNFNEARTALELVLAELQASDLDVEAMAGLYQRGRAYAQRCETILDQVEQEVLIWNDLANPDASPLRYEPEPDPT